MAILVLCRNETCPENFQSANPRPMVVTAEYHAAWTFKCERCGWLRVWTKDKVGGTMGMGRRNDGSGPAGGKGPSKWRQGVSL